MCQFLRLSDLLRENTFVTLGRGADLVSILSLFGFDGSRRRSKAFGRRDNRPSVPPSDVSASHLSTAIKSPQATIPIQAARLEKLLGEINLLFEDELNLDETLPFILRNIDGEPRLELPYDAVVTIDAESGLLTFSDQSRPSGLVVVTASEDRIIDCVICHLSTAPGQLAPQTANSAVAMLIGQTVESVERNLILQTLRHCHGSRTHAARMLGISLHTIRGKLRSYLNGPPPKRGEV